MQHLVPGSPTTGIRRRRAGLFVVIAGLAGTFAVAPTIADAAPSAAPPNGWHGGRHCVATAAPATATSGPTRAALRCFGSFRQAIRYATGGSVELSRRADLRASEPAIRRIAGTASSPLLGIEYDSTGYGGASLTLRGSGGPGCTDGYTYSFGNLGTYGWNDRAASARTYSNCVGVHYRDRSLGGPSVSVFGSSSSLGSLNNQVSSVRFY